MDTGHSILAPSSGARNVQCPASTKAEAQFPEIEASHEAGPEGTAAHWVLSERLSGRVMRIGDTTANGLIVSDEMFDGAELAAEDVEFTLRCFGRSVPDTAFIERPVRIPRVHAECWGTPDVAAWVQGPPLQLPPAVLNALSAAARELWQRPGYHLFVWDYKFGHGVVEAFRNQQLIDYAVGKCDEAGLHDYFHEVVVHLRIIQPRAHHREGVVREWVTQLVDLRPYVNIRSNAAHEALSDNPRRRVGPECKHCRARHACTELQRHANDAADYAAAAPPLELSREAMGRELLYLKRAQALLDARVSGLEEHALQVFRTGQRVPFFDIERSSGRVVWKRPVPEVLALGKAMGFDLAKPPAAVTPKQAMELGFDPGLVNSMSGQNPGEAKLVQDNNEKTSRIFGRTT